MTAFRLLGPLEGPAPLPGGKPRALLARLLLDAGRVVPAATLVDDLWERPPPSAPKVLQAHVSALRKALGPEAIETRAPGYRMRAATDLMRFDGLAEQARREPDAARRGALLREALGLWRGPALVEFRREPFARLAADRLAELRLIALERRVDADLELGAHEQLVPELLALVAAEPLREPFRRQLMLALYRSGRQVDALAAYREGRRLLVDTLGVEPSRELQALEGAILRQDPSLTRGPAASARRGPIVCVRTAPLALVSALEREVLVVDFAPDAESLPAVAARLRGLGPGVRSACFTSAHESDDLVRLAREQGAELLLVADATDELLASAPCDVALLAEPRPFAPDGPVLVAFGGGRDEWPALELSAWLARAHQLPLRLIGADARLGRRDASRMLAAASLALQRFANVVAEPVVVPPGADALLAQEGSLLVGSLPAGALDATRRALLVRSRIPVLLVHGGLRPSGLAPDQTLTRFSWSAAPA
jgi:DNA-binding SARP family transcriptional activator